MNSGGGVNTLVAILDFAGYVALLLWGVRMVQTGIARAFGAELRGLLARALSNRFKAFVSGLGITALLQSSTATGLMITSFAAGGFVALTPALAVMLGANVGTTLIVQVLSFDFSFAAPVLVLLGVVMFRRGQASRTHDLGRVAIGLGLMLFALAQLLHLFDRLEDTLFMQQLLALASAELLADLLLATLLAWAAHSSIAVVLVVMSLLTQGALPVEAAFAMVLGANLGSAINPVLESGEGSGSASRRLPLGNLFNRLLGCALALPLLTPASHLLAQLEVTPARLVADFHTFFNVVMALLFLPFLGGYAKLLTRLLPEAERPDPGQPMYLDSKAQETPALALAAAAREALRMADALEMMLQSGMAGLRKGDRKRMNETRRLDASLDNLDHAIKQYLVALDQEHLDRDEQARVLQIIAFVSNLESAGEVFGKDVMKPLAQQSKRGVELSSAGCRELLTLFARLVDNTRLAAAVFVSGNRDSARQLVAEKQHFRELEMQLAEAHFGRLREGRIDSHQTSRLHLQLVNELKRINNHLVEGAAWPLLESEADGSLATSDAPANISRMDLVK